MEVHQQSDVTAIFSTNHCLVCGERIERGSLNYSQEHIFPKWFLHHNTLWEESLTLLNGSKIKYRDLKVPCCKLCNNENLSMIEERIRRGFLLGHAGIKDIDSNDLNLWLIKVYLGLLRKECTLLINRASPSKGTILDTHDLAPLRILQSILRGTKKHYNFRCNRGSTPASLFVYKIKTETAPKFNYFDTWSTMCLMLSFGDTGILVVFDMGALSAQYEQLFRSYEDKELHYLQFLELTARAVERSASNMHSPFCAVHETEHEISIDVVSSYTSSAFYRFGEFSLETLVDVYERLGGRRETLYNRSHWGGTLLLNSDGTFRETI